MIEVVAFTSTLSNSGKNRIASVIRSNVVNELLNDNSLTDSSTAEKTHFSTLQYRTNKIDNFNSCFQNFYFSRLLYIFWSAAMDWHTTTLSSFLRKSAKKARWWQVVNCFT